MHNEITCTTYLQKMFYVTISYGRMVTCCFLRMKFLYEKKAPVCVPKPFLIIYLILRICNRLNTAANITMNNHIS